MKIKVFCPNTNGKLEFTKEELERILNDAYNDGYRDGNYHHTYPWYYTSVTGSTTPCGNTATYRDVSLSGSCSDATIATSTSVESKLHEADSNAILKEYSVKLEG